MFGKQCRILHTSRIRKIRHTDPSCGTSLRTILRDVSLGYMTAMDSDTDEAIAIAVVACLQEKTLLLAKVVVAP